MRAAVQEFAQAECDKAAQGLSGESSVAAMGLSYDPVLSPAPPALGAR